MIFEICHESKTCCQIQPWNTFASTSSLENQIEASPFLKMFYLFQELQLCTIPKIVFKLKSFGALVAVCAAAMRRAATFAARDELHYSCIFSTYLVCSTYIHNTYGIYQQSYGIESTHDENMKFDIQAKILEKIHHLIDF